MSINKGRLLLSLAPTLIQLQWSVSHVGQSLSILSTENHHKLVK